MVRVRGATAPTIVDNDTVVAKAQPAAPGPWWKPQPGQNVDKHERRFYPRVVLQLVGILELSVSTACTGLGHILVGLQPQ